MSNQKQFNDLAQSLLDHLFEKKKVHLIDWDFELGGEPMQLFKAGDLYCHTIGGKDEFTNDMYFYPLSLEKVTPNDCRPFSDKDLAPRWKIEVEPHCHFKTKWGEESMISSIVAKIYRNGKCFAVKHGFTHNDAYIAAYSFLQELRNHPVDFHSRNWKEELIGRKIYYDNQPALIERVWSDDYSCNIYVVPDKTKIKEFTPQGHWLEDEEEYWEYGEGTSADLTCDKIYWFRD